MTLPSITINGQTIQMPTDHGWSAPDSIGVGARGSEIISSIWGYDMQWDNTDPENFNILYNIWFNNINTPITADLPEIGAVTYQLKTYSCYASPVTHQGFFEGFYQRVRLQLTNIDITA